MAFRIAVGTWEMLTAPRGSVASLATISNATINTSKQGFATIGVNFGNVGNFMMFDRVLSTAELQIIYTDQWARYKLVTPSVRATSGLILWLDAEYSRRVDSTPTTWKDLSDSGYDFTVASNVLTTVGDISFMNFSSTGSAGVARRSTDVPLPVAGSTVIAFTSIKPTNTDYRSLLRSAYVGPSGTSSSTSSVKYDNALTLLNYTSVPTFVANGITYNSASTIASTGTITLSRIEGTWSTIPATYTVPALSNVTTTTLVPFSIECEYKWNGYADGFAIQVFAHDLTYNMGSSAARAINNANVGYRFTNSFWSYLGQLLMSNFPDTQSGNTVIMATVTTNLTQSTWFRFSLKFDGVNTFAYNIVNSVTGATWMTGTVQDVNAATRMGTCPQANKSIVRFIGVVGGQGSTQEIRNVLITTGVGALTVHPVIIPSSTNAIGEWYSGTYDSGLDVTANLPSVYTSMNFMAFQFSSASTWRMLTASDGRVKQVATISAPINTTNSPVRGFAAIGGVPDNVSFPQSWGNVASLMAFSRLLTNAEMQTIYDDHKTRFALAS
jgi:hypothetical protein